jgi:hypothetical protein
MINGKNVPYKESEIKKPEVNKKKETVKNLVKRIKPKDSIKK